jgi:hypothetical protein
MTTERRKRPANPYTQPIAPQIVKAPGGEEETKVEAKDNRTTERQSEETTVGQGDTKMQLDQGEQETRDAAQPGQEKATIEVRLYLTPTLDDKLDALRQAYKRRTGGKRIKPNEIMRKLIEQATVENLLHE